MLKEWSEFIKNADCTLERVRRQVLVETPCVKCGKEMGTHHAVKDGEHGVLECPTTNTIH